ncbi:hypothetical protein OFO01_07365 [Campylobacter sp. JMF_01 NE2]|uniref:hypothetical protein n=1 Tax=unclassified Campylobacter TaxID=2593542 RepID=UPI0022E9F00C|nr:MULTISPECIES: hypothetical protein [unclassified Campylobacter]MDA3053217.1 hypothetical protein [Campylobacter sp. JMF_03 NE3]MDA3067600.1 hypothetical protein [Campylobacter sp. JMF_01 NE2]
MAFLKQTTQTKKRDNATSDKMKALLFEYFRFSPKQLHCVSEVICEYFTNNTVDIEDFLAFNETTRICVEVKVSKSDFLADFTKLKHKDFAKKYTKFYFCVTSDLKDFALEYLRENYNNYGLFVYENNKIQVVKNAKINKNLTFLRDEKYLFMRMSSELANEKIKIIE